VCVSLAVLAVILGGKRISDKIPGGLIAVVAAIGVSWAMDLGAHLETLGAVPSGLPTLALPHVAWSWALIQKLLPIAFACFVVILAQSAATSRAYAAKYSDRFDENVDMVGLGMANLGAVYPVPSSSMAVRPTRQWWTVAVAAARCRSSLPAALCCWSCCF
jgi:SulP family sulfate permease